MRRTRSLRLMPFLSITLKHFELQLIVLVEGIVRMQKLELWMASIDSGQLHFPICTGLGNLCGCFLCK